MDDKLVDAANYTLQSGSTIKDDVPKTAVATGGALAPIASTIKDDVPKTGDNAPIAGLFALMLISGTVLCITHKKKAVRK